MATPALISEASICSMALTEIGDEAIVSLTDNSVRARLCNRFYPIIRDEMLQEKHWKFATTTLALSKLATTPPNVQNFSSAFLLPPDYLHLQDTGLDKGEQWKIENGVVFANSDSFTMKYTFKQPDPTKFPPLFVKALKFNLAMNLSLPITGQKQTFDRMQALYEDAMQDAATKAGQQDFPESFEVSDLVDVRLDAADENFTHKFNV